MTIPHASAAGALRVTLVAALVLGGWSCGDAAQDGAANTGIDGSGAFSETCVPGLELTPEMLQAATGSPLTQ